VPCFVTLAHREMECVIMKVTFAAESPLHPPSTIPWSILRAPPDRQRANKLLKALEILGMDDRAPSGYLQEKVRRLESRP
jgi:hypothetical protein